VRRLPRGRGLTPIPKAALRLTLAAGHAQCTRAAGKVVEHRTTRMIATATGDRDAQEAGEWLRARRRGTDASSEWDKRQGPLEKAGRAGSDDRPPPRCKVRYPSGQRCVRRARVRGVCCRCARRAAAVRMLTEARQ
jgi:hypothetical protein